MNDVAFQKAQSIQRCVARARSELATAGDRFADDYTRQDAAMLNVTRACEQAIDLANHVVKVERLGAPASSAESFQLLSNAGIVPRSLSENLRRMIGFRNIAVHDYQGLNLDVVIAAISEGTKNLVEFSQIILKRS